MRSALSFFSVFGRTRRAVYVAFCLATIPVSAIAIAAGTVWVSIIAIAVLGYSLVCLVLSVWPGTNGANRYGRDPRRPDDIAEVFDSLPTLIRLPEGENPGTASWF